MGTEQKSDARAIQPTASGVKAVPKPRVTKAGPPLPPPGRLPKTASLPKGVAPQARSEPPSRREETQPIDVGSPPPTDADSSLAVTIPPTEPPAIESLAPPRTEPTEDSFRTSVPSDVSGELPDAIARFGRFDIMGRLASGGMADLFLARESTEGDAASRHTVIKVIKGEHSEHGTFAEMFMNEGRLAMRLTHPNICTVYECGREDGRYFMAMEYVHGKTLREVLVRAGGQKRKLEIGVILKLFSIVAEALEFAHRARDAKGKHLNIVHRDVSPANIMVRYDGVVKLIDFGVAKAERSAHQTESGALKGKFSYMSPEQALGDPLDARADIFSLGVVLFETVTGRRLFHRKAQYDTLKAILETEPPSLGTYRDDIPEGLDDLLGKALSKRADERFESAADMQHALASLLAKSGEVVSASTIARLMNGLFGDAAHATPELDASAEVIERFAALPEPAPPDRRPVIAVVAIIAVLALGVVVYALTRGGETAEPPGAPPVTDVEPPPDVAPPPPVPPPEETAPGIESPTPPDEAGGTGPAEDDPPSEETASEPPDEETQGQRRRRRRRSSGSGGSGGGTVIVTDPGF